MRFAASQLIFMLYMQPTFPQLYHSFVLWCSKWAICHYLHEECVPFQPVTCNFFSWYTCSVNTIRPCMSTTSSAEMAYFDRIKNA